jgi:hypothetical protein
MESAFTLEKEYYYVVHVAHCAYIAKLGPVGSEYITPARV